MLFVIDPCCDSRHIGSTHTGKFLQLWDGMLSEDVENKYGIVVVGAT